MSRNDDEKLIAHMNQAAYRTLFADTMRHGVELAPRGEKIKELNDTQLEIHPWYPFQTMVGRHYKLDYFKHEMRWKLGANPYDESIKAHASMWDAVQNPDGTFNSNYGQFWFGPQKGLWKVVEELIRDRDSRRASIPMLRDDHLNPEVKDTVCTEAVTFHIREYQLRMSVHMRSSDQIFGLGTDVPTFSVLLMLVLGILRENYPGLQAGPIKLTAASSHIYERHWGKVRDILDRPINHNLTIRLPEPSGVPEVLRIIADRGRPQHCQPHWYLYRFIYGSS